MERELHVILDFKRGDIGISAAHYAASADGRCDWLTANPYLGVDGLEPFIRPTASGRRLGAFALVRTSNPGGDAIQSLRLEDGRTVAQSVADLVAEAGEACLGGSGYSALGAVVGATKAGDAVELRRRMPRQIFLQSVDFRPALQKFPITPNGFLDLNMAPLSSVVIIYVHPRTTRTSLDTLNHY